ncbi:MAG: RNA polymerase sigma factor [Myxococcota bacterium]
MSAKILPFRAPEVDRAELSDEALLAACALQDQAALAVLWRRHKQPVYRFVCRLVGASSGNVDDVVQQVFLAVWKNADGYRAQSTVRAWIFGIAANLAWRHRRSAFRRATAFERLSHWIQKSEPSPHGKVMSKEMLEKVGEAIAQLPHDLRVAYVMCEIEEIPGVDAAKALGVRPGTIWRRVHEAKKYLYEVIARDHGEP